MGPWVGAALTGLGALGGLFGSKKQTTDSSYNSTTTPTYDAKNQSFRDALIDMFTKQINGQGLDKFQNSYTNSGLKNIVMSQNNASQAASDALAARGIDRTTAGASALTDTSYRGASSSADFLNQIPLIMDQLKQSRLAAAAGYQASLPVGTTQSGTSHTVGTGGASSPVAGVLGGGASGLAAYLGQISANNQFGNILKNLNLGGGGSVGNISLPSGTSGWGQGG